MPARTTTKTTKPAEPEVEYDFDGWDEAAEEAALAALADSFKYVLVEKTFVGRFHDGTIVKIPLEFSLDVLDSIEDIQSPVDQLRGLLTEIGDKATADFIIGKPVTQLAACASTYFDVVQRVTEKSIQKLKQVRLGE